MCVIALGNFPAAVAFAIRSVELQRAKSLQTMPLPTAGSRPGQNEALKKYSMETLPEVMAHLEHAKENFAILTQGAGSRR